MYVICVGVPYFLYLSWDILGLYYINIFFTRTKDSTINLRLREGGLMVMEMIVTCDDAKVSISYLVTSTRGGWKIATLLVMPPKRVFFMYKVLARWNSQDLLWWSNTNELNEFCHGGFPCKNLFNGTVVWTSPHDNTCPILWISEVNGLSSTWTFMLGFFLKWLPVCGQVHRMTSVLSHGQIHMMEKTKAWLSITFKILSIGQRDDASFFKISH